MTTTTTLYSASVRPALAALRNLAAILAKAQQYVAERGGAEEALLDDRLIYDMFPLKKQVQIASDNAKGLAARLAGVEVPKMEDTEATIAELIARLEKTIAFMETITPEQVNARDGAEIPYPYDASKALIAADYAALYALPNFYFHVTAAYAILRKNGLGIGKSDYIGALPFIENQA